MRYIHVPSSYGDMVIIAYKQVFPWNGDGEEGGGSGNDDLKKIKMCHIYVPNPHNKCIYYVLQTSIDFKKT